MPEATADSQNVHTRGDELRGVRMAQCVQADRWQLELRQDTRPLRTGRGGDPWRAVPFRKHQGILRSLAQPKSQTLLLLLLPVCPQLGHHRRGKTYGPSTVPCFRRLGPEASNLGLLE